ncbi:MAG: type II toxin-antitoxin system Phd/YefM family antitoxin [Kiritimatiellae bacterium]|nr:type II toxin-antitoxin system Phd/YefM family antitoxin [Kiritimatiellia bacterium]MBQ6341424.1 type II toxin-antitoxin system Phd/YefM family antitoxin [Kiritimatiellia bacterium]
MPVKEMTLQRPRLDKDVVSYTECRQTLADCMQRTRRTHRPLVITQNGHAASILLDISDFEDLWADNEARREREELSRSVEISRDQFERGEFISHHDLMARLKKQLDERTLA